MAPPGLSAAAVPSEPELQSFAHAAAHLLIERVPRMLGSRVVARRAGIGLQHLDHREYVPGDEVRHIDWRVTARMRRPLVRRFEAETVSDWTVVLDASSSMAVCGGAKWRAGVSVAAAMAHALLHLGHRVGLLVFGARVLARCPRGRGRHHYAAIVATLASLRPAATGERSELGSCARHLHGAASVFAISDFLADDEMRRDLGALLGHCTTLHALQVSDERETRLPAVGEIELVDSETGAQAPIEAGAQAASAAALQRAASAARLRAFCQRSGIAHTDWEIRQPWQQTLIDHLVRARSVC